MRVLIVGAGAIGTSIAYHLAARGAAAAVLCAGPVRQSGGESPLCNLMEVKHE
jgi:glycine/D-amino acid oxidase-like deaminating enzyme